MTKTHRTDVEAVFIVVRLDLPVSGDDPQALIQRFTIVEALPTEAEADAEVGRLSAVNTGSRCAYFSQYVRYYPSGRAVSDS